MVKPLNAGSVEILSKLASSECPQVEVKKSIYPYFHEADKLYGNYQKFNEEGDEERAYVYLFAYSMLVIERIKKEFGIHIRANEDVKVRYLEHRDRVQSGFEVLEGMKKRLQQRYELDQRLARLKAQKPPNVQISQNSNRIQRPVPSPTIVQRPVPMKLQQQDPQKHFVPSASPNYLQNNSRGLRSLKNSQIQNTLNSVNTQSQKQEEEKRKKELEEKKRKEQKERRERELEEKRKKQEEEKRKKEFLQKQEEEKRKKELEEKKRNEEKRKKELEEKERRERELKEKLQKQEEEKERRERELEEERLKEERIKKEKDQMEEENRRNKEKEERKRREEEKQKLLKAQLEKLEEEKQRKLEKEKKKKLEEKKARQEIKSLESLTEELMNRIKSEEAFIENYQKKAENTQPTNESIEARKRREELLQQLELLGNQLKKKEEERKELAQLMKDQQRQALLEMENQRKKEQEELRILEQKQQEMRKLLQDEENKTMGLRQQVENQINLVNQVVSEHTKQSSKSTKLKLEQEKLKLQQLQEKLEEEKRKQEETLKKHKESQALLDQKKFRLLALQEAREKEMEEERRIKEQKLEAEKEKKRLEEQRKQSDLERMKQQEEEKKYWKQLKELEKSKKKKKKRIRFKSIKNFLGLRSRSEDTVLWKPPKMPSSLNPAPNDLTSEFLDSHVKKKEITFSSDDEPSPVKIETVKEDETLEKVEIKDESTSESDAPVENIKPLHDISPPKRPKSIPGITKPPRPKTRPGVKPPRPNSRPKSGIHDDTIVETKQGVEQISQNFNEDGNDLKELSLNLIEDVDSPLNEDSCTGVIPNDNVKIVHEQEEEGKDKLQDSVEMVETADLETPSKHEQKELEGKLQDASEDKNSDETPANDYSETQTNPLDQTTDRKEFSNVEVEADNRHEKRNEVHVMENGTKLEVDQDLDNENFQSSHVKEKGELERKTPKSQEIDTQIMETIVQQSKEEATEFEKPPEPEGSLEVDQVTPIAPSEGLQPPGKLKPPNLPHPPSDLLNNIQSFDSSNLRKVPQSSPPESRTDLLSGIRKFNKQQLRKVDETPDLSTIEHESLSDMSISSILAYQLSQLRHSIDPNEDEDDFSSSDTDSDF